MEIQSFNDVTFFPLERIRKRRHAIIEVGGKIEASLLEHYEFFKGIRTSIITVKSRVARDVSEEILDRAIFGGYLFGHYGHFLAESIHRLWPTFDNAEYANLPIVFYSFSGGPELRPFMLDIFKYLKIDPGRVHIIRQPTRIRELIVPTQGKFLRGPPMSANYSKMFEKFIPKEKLPGFKNIYVSRSRYLNMGSYLGEALVDEILEKAGVRVIYPEDHSIADLVSFYMNAESIIFSEGSAIHVLELCSGLRAQVMVICRREQSRAERLFQAASAMVAGGLRYFGIQWTLPPLKTNRDGQPLGSDSVAVVDMTTLFHVLKDFFDLPLDIPEPRMIEKYMLTDLAKVMIGTGDLKNPKATADQFLLLRERVINARIFPNILG